MGSIHVASEIDCKLLSEHPIDITTVKGQKPQVFLGINKIELKFEVFKVLY